MVRALKKLLGKSFELTRDDVAFLFWLQEFKALKHWQIKQARRIEKKLDNLKEKYYQEYVEYWQEECASQAVLDEMTDGAEVGYIAY